MTRSCKLLSAFVSASLAVSPQLILAQQVNLQTSLLAPGSVRPLPPGSSVSTIADTEHLSYAGQIAKDRKEPVAEVHLNASDILIQQAEERFQAGRKFYREHDYPHARQAFDGAVDAMLSASENPSDRALYETKLEEMVDAIHRDDVSKMGAAAESDTAEFDKAPLDDIIQMTFPIDPSIRTQVQTEVRGTASALPLVVNDAVLSYINYFNGRGRKTIEAGLAREGRYAPMVSRLLAEEGIPQELIHLAQAESGFLPRAVSRAAAEGMWQFVKFRGNQYGLVQTSYSDDRLDPEKATRAAARHLHDLYNEFGDWYLAIAAYNCGPGAVERAVERTGYADFFELRARGALPNETTNYVPIILAMTIMSKNAKTYGLDQIVPDPAIEYDTIHATSTTNLALIGDLTDTPVSQLLQLNPALLRSMAPAGFDVHVPKGTGEQVTAGLELIPAERRAAWRLHRVEPGETMFSIAKSFALSARQIATANRLADAEPAPGDQLLIPALYHESATPLRVPAAGRTTARSRRPSALAAQRTQPVSAHNVAAKPAHRPTGVTIAQAKSTQPLIP